jgi:CBS domain-containing protein
MTTEPAGVPPGGFRIVDQISGTNATLFRGTDSGLSVAIELISEHVSGAPVISEGGTLIGFISEFDVLRALEEGHDLAKIRADQIMSKCPIIIRHTTTLKDAVRVMEEYHLLVLPVEKDGVVAYSITRHDLLRAWVGLGPGAEKEAA